MRRSEYALCERLGLTVVRENRHIIAEDRHGQRIVISRYILQQAMDNPKYERRILREHYRRDKHFDILV